MVNGVNLNNPVNNVKDKNDVYQGSINPSFISTNEPEPGETKGPADTTAISSTTPGAVNSAMSAAILSPGATPTPDDAGYIKNTPTPPSPSPTPPSPPPPPPPGDSGNAGGVGGGAPAGDTNGTNSAMDVAGDVDQGMDDFWNSVLQNPMYTQDDNGFQSLDGDKLEQLYRRLLELMNTRLFLVMFMEQRSEIQDLIFKAFLNTDLSDENKKTSLVELVGKSNAKMSKFFQKGISILMTNITNHNNARLQELLDEADAAKGDGWSNYWTSDGDQKHALEMAEDAKKEYKAAMDRSVAAMNHVFGSSFVGLTPETQRNGDQVMAELKDSENHITYNSDGFIDTGAFKQYLVDLRNEFVGLLNMNRAVVSAAREKESVQKSMFEAITGKSGLSERLGGAEEAVEAENAHQTVLFDQTASSIMEVQKVKNDIKFIDKQIEKIDNSRWEIVLGNIFEAVAIVATIVVAVAVSIVTWGSAAAGAVAGAVALVGLIVAVCAGICAAAFKYGAAETADAVDDDYTPSVDTYTPPDNKARDKDRKNLVDQSADLQYEEEMLVNGVGMGQIMTITDGDDAGYLAVDNGQIANLTRELNGIQNALRVIAKMMKQQAEIRRMIERALTGLSGGSASGNLTSAALDEVMKQMGVQFQELVSNLSEYKDAQNSEIQQARQMEAARINFAVSMVTAVVAAVIGACVPGVGGLMGALIGFSIGMALGSALGQYIAASEYDTRDTSYTPNVDDWEPVGNVGKGRSGSVLAHLDTEAFNVYNELFAVGTCDAGDGNIGLNTGKIQALQKRLENIFITFANIASTVEAKSKMLKAIWQSLGVVTDETETMSDMVRGNFDTAMKVFQSAVKALSEEVEVSNRANAAQQQYDNAVTKLAVTVVLLAASIVTGAATSTAVLNLCLSVSNLVISAIDMVNSWMRARNDTGELETMAAQTTPEDAKSVKGKMTSEQQILEKAEEMEAGISVNSQMVVEVGGGNVGINSGIFDVQSAAMEKLERIKDLIGDVVNQGKDVKSRLARVFYGVRPNSTNAIETAGFISSTVARAMLQTEMQAVQQLVSRENQINQAEKNAILQSVSTGISAIEVAISIASFAKTNGAVKEYKDMQKLIASKPDAKNQLSQQEVNRITENYKDALKTQQSAAYANFTLTCIQTIVDSLYIYGAAHWDGTPEHSDKQVSDSKNKENVAKNRAALSSSQGASATAAAANFDAVEAESTTLSLESGNYDLDMQFNEILRNADTQLMQTDEGHLKTLLGQATSIMDGVDKQEKAKLAVEYGKEKIELADREKDFKNKAAAATAAQARYNAAVAEFKAESDKPQKTNGALAGRLEELEKKVQDAKKDLDRANAEVTNSYDSWKRSAAKLVSITLQQNARLGKKTDLPPQLQALADHPVSDEEVFRAADNVMANQSLDLTFQTEMDGKKVDVTLTVENDGQTRVNFTAPDGQKQSLTLTQYVGYRETEVKNKVDAANKKAVDMDHTANIREDDANKAEENAKKIKTPATAAEAKEKREIAIKSRAAAVEAKKEAEEAKKIKYSFNDDDVRKHAIGQATASYERTSQAMKTFSDDLASTQTAAVSSEVSIEADKAMAAMNKMDDELKDKRGNRELKDMSADELQAHYETTYKEVFLPTREELQQILREKSDANAEVRQLKAEDKAEEDLVKAGKLELDDAGKAKRDVRRARISELEIKLGDISQREGTCRARIKSFNQYIGQINTEYHKKTATGDNPKGRDLTPVKIDARPAAEVKPPADTNIAPQPKADKPAAVVAGTADATPKPTAPKGPSDPVVLAVLNPNNKLIVDKGKVKINGNNEISVEDLRSKIKATLDAADKGQIDLPKAQKERLETVLKELAKESVSAPGKSAEAAKGEGSEAVATTAVADNKDAKKAEGKSGNIWKSEFAEDLRSVLAKVEEAGNKLKGYSVAIDTQQSKAQKIKSMPRQESMHA